MTIDMMEVRDDLVTHLYEGLQVFQNLSLGQVGAALLATGGVLALHALYKDWTKKKGYRMAVRERTDKERRLLEEIINDGLFEAEFAGKISEQRMNALYQFCSDKLDLPDLIPKERRTKLVKEQVKARLIKSGKLDISQWKKTTFSDTVGKFKFW